MLAFLFTLDIDLRVMDRWSERPWLYVFPAIGAAASVILFVAWRRRVSDWLPFAMSAVIFLTAFLTLAGSFWPYMIPFSVTIQDAAAPPESLTFMFYGAGLVAFPIVLIYTIAVYWIFRGKVDGDVTYS